MMTGQTYFVMRNSKLMFSFKVTSILPLLFLGCYEGIVTGQLTLSPVMVAPVCSVGDPLELTCTATLTGSVQIIRWSIFRVINDQGTLSEITNSVLIDNRDDNQVKSKEVASTTFTYARISTQFASPLVSTLYIDSVGIGLNGTVVNCSDVTNPMTSASTTIYISAASNTVALNQNTLSVHIVAYDFDNLTVTVEWTQQVVNGVTYTPGVSPTPLVIINNENSSSQLLLVLKYNTEYNLSVMANSCGVTATAIKTLYYVNCGYPELLSAVNDSQAPDIVGYDNLKPVKGSTVTFSCPPGLELNGSNSATCTGNGEWEPDPSWLTCNESDSQGALSQVGIIAVAASSLASILIFASILLFVGCLWRRFSKKKKRLIDRLPPSVTYRKQPPHYDVVQFPPKQELPLKPNESYHSR